ncbi:hypothetical protein C8Q73DRAFT_787558 [Cubamyces lactineus]|nr:hypothetical protein C8Q73DRAFT_787558 [Cubamyces lactineus]
MSVKFVTAGMTRAEALRRKDAALGTVNKNKLPTSLNAPAKHHIGIRMIQVTIGVTIGLFVSQILVYTLGRCKNTAHFTF